MIFETLTLTNFGVFKDHQLFDLTPRIKYGSRRPIILFGGLNGSGKTSILTAIRLALHGRQALGFGTAQKKYESLLSRLFHQDAHSLLSSETMSVKLDFTYSNLGGATRYTIERHWSKSNKGITEQFSVLADGHAIESTDPEQAQVFLTQLVPVGVADLFFFDGEKIADLASEDNGGMLAESIQRLLGLDVVSKLRTDLDVYERRQGRKQASADNSEITTDSLFEEIEANKSSIDERYHKIRQEIEPAISSVRIELDKLEGRLSERGGAWAVSRDVFQTKLTALLEKKSMLESKLRELAAGILPLALAPSVTKALLLQLESESEQGKQLDIKSTLEKHKTTLNQNLYLAGFTGDINAVIKAVSDIFKSPVSTRKNAIHALGESDKERLITSLKIALPEAKKTAKTLGQELSALDEELSFISGRIAAAPSEEQLQDDFNMLKQANKNLGNLLAQKRFLLEDVKTLTWRQIELVRRLKRDHAKNLDRNSKSETAIRITAIKGALDIFSERLVTKKTSLLAEYFLQSFRQLIRKDSLISSATVDPKTLTLKLLGAHGKEIQKSQLSAGERQLFAIAMLDALAKTSGRTIPIIIDTPLGRLDSRHRNNLVKHYLPHASHQVVVLSTDTEVDEHFFQDLKSSVSHAYHLDFDEPERATTAREGYFWRQKEVGGPHAA